MASIRRYHRDIYFPDWFQDSFAGYTRGLRERGPLSFSFHAVDKILEQCHSYGRILFKYLTKTCNKSSLDSDKVFEFYTVGKEIRKVCFRFSFDKSPVDIVLVISKEGNVVTVYTINKGDKHQTLDKSLYEKGD